MRISIIVPILNEAEGMAAMLDHLNIWKERGCEVLLVDGGSQDHSVAQAAAAGFHVLHANRGRATQMNAGAKASNGDILLFLHADTRLPPEADSMVTMALRDKDGGWGRFDVVLDDVRPLLRLVSAMINFRSRLTGIATGDQAIFIDSKLFDETGGFPDQQLMEDVELSHRLKQRLRPVCLIAKVTTSARRWQQYGTWRTIVLMWRLRWLYWRGVDADRLAELYR